MINKNKYKTLTLKDVIETLVTYDIEHCRFPHNYAAEIIEDIPIMNGLAIDDKKLILIDKERGLEDTREIVIHELLHTKHYRMGDLSGMQNIEKHVIRETDLTLKRLYGKK